MNDDNRNKMHVHFSPTHKISIGLNIEYFHDEELFFNSIQVNNLLKRWNKKKRVKQICILSLDLVSPKLIKMNLTENHNLQGLQEYHLIGKIEVILLSMKIVISKLEKSTILLHNLQLLV
jgi:enterochelin esterase-like enzyme